MDRLIYTAMSGAAQALEQQSVTANKPRECIERRISRAAFRVSSGADELRETSASGDPTTRTFVLSSTPTADYTPGPIQQTGNPLDVAVQGPGWLSVQTEDGGRRTRVPAICTLTQRPAGSRQQPAGPPATAVRCRFRPARK